MQLRFTPVSLRLLAVAVMSFCVSPVAAQPNEYRRVEHWAKVPADFRWTVIAAVVPDREENLWVVQRGNPPILKFDKFGNLVKSFGNDLFLLPHGLFIDNEGFLWIPDSGPFNEKGRVPGKGFQVFKLDQNGKVLMTLGKPNVPQAGPDTFLAPSGVVVNEKGEIFVADGHTPRPGQQNGDRIVVFSRDGRMIRTWGTTGSAPGELHGPHGIAMDSRGRLFVADRVNNRVQLFDQSGKYLDHWTQFSRPSGVWVDRQDKIYLAHNADPDRTVPGWAFGIRIGSAKDGTLTGFIPDLEGEVVATDNQGNVYVGEGNVLHKFVKR